MKHRHAILYAALATSLSCSAFAQGAPRSVQQVAPRAAPAPSITAAPAPNAPAAAGLPSPSPFPQGLPSVQPFPQGVPSSVLNPPGTPAPGNRAGPAAPVAPAPAIGGSGTPATPQSVPSGPSGYTPLQLAQSFRHADSNLDGELTRAEATRLTIMPISFEEMDRDKDGILSKSEYEDGVR